MRYVRIMTSGLIVLFVGMFLGAYEMADYVRLSEIKDMSATARFIMDANLGLLHKLMALIIATFLAAMVWPKDSLEVENFKRKTRDAERAEIASLQM